MIAGRGSDYCWPSNQYCVWCAVCWRAFCIKEDRVASVRPKLPEGATRSATIFAKVRPAEKALLDKRAAQLERSTSSIVRDAVLVYLDNHQASVRGKD